MNEKIDFSGLNLDKSTVKVIEELLDQLKELIKHKPDNTITILDNLKTDLINFKPKKSSDQGKIHASVKELKSAFKYHYDIINRHKEDKSASIYLLVFYAVECGLKAVWLKNNGLSGTDQIQDQALISEKGHDLTVWTKKLRLPATITGKYDTKEPRMFHLSRDKSSWDIGKIHQTWRYGVKIDSDDEQKLVAWLNQVSDWIKEKI